MRLNSASILKKKRRRSSQMPKCQRGRYDEVKPRIRHSLSGTGASQRENHEAEVKPEDAEMVEEQEEEYNIRLSQ